jgi:predicted CopG family antitoxin
MKTIEISEEVYSRLLEQKSEDISWDLLISCLLDGWNELGLMDKTFIARDRMDEYNKNLKTNS